MSILTDKLIFFLNYFAIKFNYIHFGKDFVNFF